MKAPLKQELSRALGWKTYLGCAGLFVLGVALLSSQFLNAMACICLSVIFIGIRDAMGKLIMEVRANGLALADVRAAVETSLDRKVGP
ncbi:MAG TPA: hypothetical protein VJU84_08675 [Pyrinomonadaceae bacterium]|nr:hypothetical protein [Pyrinomonadaceae bacterium]